MGLKLGISRRALVIGVWSLSVLIALGIGWWAANQATNPTVVASPKTEKVTVPVINGSLSVEQSYGINVVWPTSPVGVNGATGTLTSIPLSPAGTEVNEGDVLYTVDLLPTIAIQGEVPAFREIGPGSSGKDVLQLEQFLNRKGYLLDHVDGIFGTSTSRAIANWDRALGIPVSTSVPPSQIVFIPSLPAVLAPSNDVRVGSMISAGQSILVGASASPTFSFRVLPEMVSSTVPGMNVKIAAGDKTWTAEVDHLEASADDPNVMVAILRPASGADSICGVDCSVTLKLGGTSVLPGTLILSPETSGSQIPTAAISTNAAGETFVTLQNGKTKPVVVLVSNDGQSIVTGVDVGERILVTGTTSGG